MKVLLINTVNLEANGISTFIINTASQLAKNNIDVTILAPNKVNRGLVITLKRQDIHLKQILGRMSNPIKYFNNLKIYLSSEKFDVVHVNGNSTTMAIELFAAKLAKIKLRIAHSHNTKTEHSFTNKLLRPLFNYSVNGRLACNEASGKWLFKRKKFIIVRNGIDLNKYKYSLEQRKKIRKELDIKPNQKLLGHVGYFNYQKNQIFLVHILKKLPNDYKLIFIGEGNDLKNVKVKVDECGLKDRVIFTGNVTNVPDYLSAMDLFLLPSRFEGQPFSLIEATANGLGCIVSDRVSPESDLAGNIEFLSIGDADQIKWEESIKKENLSDRERKSALYKNKLKDKGYSLIDNVDMLLKFYLKRNKDGKNN